jgi:hypothetical protein
MGLYSKQCTCTQEYGYTDFRHARSTCTVHTAFPGFQMGQWWCPAEVRGCINQVSYNTGMMCMYCMHIMKPKSNTGTKKTWRDRIRKQCTCALQCWRELYKSQCLKGIKRIAHTLYMGYEDKYVCTLTVGVILCVFWRSIYILYKRDHECMS